MSTTEVARDLPGPALEPKSAGRRGVHHASAGAELGAARRAQNLPSFRLCGTSEGGWQESLLYVAAKGAQSEAS